MRAAPEPPAGSRSGWPAGCAPTAWTSTSIRCSAARRWAASQAVVVGSPIYSGHWETEAVDFVRRNARALAGHPVWTFSVGWPGRGDAGPREAKNLAAVHRIVPPREHRFFLGALNPADLRWSQRLTFRLRGGTSGDFRDWAAIDAWTDEIARQLTVSSSYR
jgi:menaquinone-dependent protoporphyrinogen oxidase